MDEAEKQRKFERLRAALDGIQLEPEQTSDDIKDQSEDTGRDKDILRDVPPHHGN